MSTALAVILFLVVLVLVIWQPRGLSIGWSAASGAILALALGVVTLRDVVEVLRIVWDPTLTFVALILISLVMDELGFFEWAALHMARFSKGKGRRLFLYSVLLGAAVAAFFANDGAALILTPIVYGEVKALGLNPRAVLAFVMAGGFIADTTSLPLMISNLVNILSADYFHLGFVEYARHMAAVDLVAAGASLLALFLFFRRDLPGRVELARLRPPAAAVRDIRLFRRVWWALAVLLLGYFLSQFLQVPVSVVAGSVAAALLWAARRSSAVHVGRILRQAPWKIVVFSVGMYVVVFGLRNAGLTNLLSHAVQAVAQAGPGPAILFTGFLAAFLSSVMNNMPTVMIDALAIHGTALPVATQHYLAYANVIGCDLGPKITPIGSLATLLWLHVLERRQVRITWGYYFRIGFTLTVPVLLVTLLGLWGWWSLVG